MLIRGNNNNDVWGHDADRMAVSLADDAPFKLELIQPKVPLVRNGSMDLKVVATRAPGYTAPINIKLLYTLVFGLGAALAGFAGLMQAPILTVQVGMGENILILAFVVIIIGGIGSIRGAFVAAILVGLIDTVGRAFIPDLLRSFLSTNAASSAGPAMSSMLIYMLMAGILVVRPEGLFPTSGK